MEMGLGFMAGLLAGTVIAIIGAVIIMVARRVATVAPAQAAAEIRSLADTEVLRASPKPVETAGPAGAASHAAGRGSGHTTAPGRGSGHTATAGRGSGSAAAVGKSAPHHPDSTAAHDALRRNTIVIDQVDLRDRQFNKNIQDVRDLLLRLADVIATTETASGEAAAAFSNARKTIDNLDSDDHGDLSTAQQLLIGEIDRVIKSNAKLQGELDKANQGIAEQRRQIEELRVQARIDALTRIANRTAFDERLQEYIALLNRTALTFTLLLIDIDFFKSVNDEHGHVNGDRILRGVASRISEAVRTNDFAARYGGEEFAVIFPGTKVDDAYLVAERMRKDIAKTKFRLDDKTIQMTVSGGMAECRPGMKAEQIIEKADTALYRAKNGGRNRVIADGVEASEKAPSAQG